MLITDQQESTRCRYTGLPSLHALLIKDTGNTFRPRMPSVIIHLFSSNPLKKNLWACVCLRKELMYN